VNSGGQTIARYIMGAALISQKRGGATYCYHFDALGSTRALTDASEVVQNTYEYDAYGNVLAKTENVTNPYQFATAFGYYADPDTGLLYLRARYYSPSIGRFISLDSYLGQANDPMSLHRYLYCRGNPLVWVDPSGYLGFSLLGLQISITWGTSGLGALAGAICNVIGAMLAGEKDWATLICAAFSGAIIGGISGGIMGSISADVIGGFAAFLAQGIANSLLSAANLVQPGGNPSRV
jgi:RHS repeat-associated protein